MACCIGIDVSTTALDLAALPDGESRTATNDDLGLADLTPRLVSSGTGSHSAALSSPTRRTSGP